MTRHDRVRAAAGAWLALTLQALAAAHAAESSDATKPITLGADEQARLGVVTQALASVPAPAGVTTTARVLDPGPLLQLEGELSAAAASFAASRAEAARTRKLYSEDRTVSTRAVETAQAQAQADQQHLYGLERRLRLEWGDGVAGLPARRRAAVMNDLARLRSELVRVEWPAQLPVPKAGTTIDLQGSPDAAALQARVLGMLPLADPRLQTRGVLVELAGPQATLAVGQLLSAQLPASESATGVVLPRGALLRKGSQVWAYVQTAPTSFVRREVTGFRPLEAGWFVSTGFAAGERVVSAGAAALLGVETAGAAGAGGGD
jgi:hypothetical protein